jgi:hypothetical protein
MMCAKKLESKSMKTNHVIVRQKKDAWSGDLNTQNKQSWSHQKAYFNTPLQKSIYIKTTPLNSTSINIQKKQQEIKENRNKNRTVKKERAKHFTAWSSITKKLKQNWKPRKEKIPRHHSIRLDVMFKTIKLPTSIAYLNPRLSYVNAYYFSHLFSLTLSTHSLLSLSVRTLKVSLSVFLWRCYRSREGCKIFSWISVSLYLYTKLPSWVNYISTSIDSEHFIPVYVL